MAARTAVRGSLALGGVHKPVEWLWWAGNDAGRRLRYGDESRLYGITAYVGLFGAGKTLSAVERAYREKQRRGDRLKVWSNCPVAFADGPISGYQQLLDCHADGHNHLFLFDEIHLSWRADEWNHVDPEVLTALTQQRKWGSGFAVFYTTQRLSQTATLWRRLAGEIVECRGWPTSRWVHQTAYAGIEAYNEGVPRRAPGGTDDLREVSWRHSFIAEDWLRALYRTDWVAARISRHGEVGLIGREAVQAKLDAAAGEVGSQLAAANAAAAADATVHALRGTQPKRSRGRSAGWRQG